jgi:hypothetical protein
LERIQLLLELKTQPRPSRVCPCTVPLAQLNKTVATRTWQFVKLWNLEHKIEKNLMKLRVRVHLIPRNIRSLAWNFVQFCRILTNHVQIFFLWKLSWNKILILAWSHITLHVTLSLNKTVAKCGAMDKLELAGWNLGRVFISRKCCMYLH